MVGLSLHLHAVVGDRGGVSVTYWSMCAVCLPLRVSHSHWLQSRAQAVQLLLSAQKIPALIPGALAKMVAVTYRNLFPSPEVLPRIASLEFGRIQGLVPRGFCLGKKTFLNGMAGSRGSHLSNTSLTPDHQAVRRVCCSPSRGKTSQSPSYAAREFQEAE